MPRQLSTTSSAAWFATTIAALTTALCIHYNTFSPWGTDPAAYFDAAQRWERGELMRPEPLSLWASWSAEGVFSVPLGTRPSAVRGTDASGYPPGFPLLMATAARIGGDTGAYLVPPVAAGVIVVAAFALGRRLAGPWCGVLASLMVALSPVVTVLAVQPMSDVPCAACWAVAWLMSLRRGLAASAAAGAAVALAILIRPAMAPLGLVIAALVIRSSRPTDQRRDSPWPAVLAFAATACMGVAVLGWSQAVLYGNPLTPSYQSPAAMYSLQHVAKNLEMYPRFLRQLHSPLVFAALAAPVVAKRLARPTPDAFAMAVSGVAIVAATFAPYVAYWPYDDPVFLRFMLPAVVAILILDAALVVWLITVARRRHWTLAALAALPAVVIMFSPGRLLTYAYDIRAGEGHVPVMGAYLREVLPANAVVLAHFHGGAVAYYTGAPVVRLDLNETRLDLVVRDLRTNGYLPVFVLGGEELEMVRTRFKGSAAAHLDWPARARAVSVGELLYFRVDDRDRHLNGQRWVTDVLRAPP